MLVGPWSVNSEVTVLRLFAFTMKMYIRLPLPRMERPRCEDPFGNVSKLVTYP